MRSEYFRFYLFHIAKRKRIQNRLENILEVKVNIFVESNSTGKSRCLAIDDTQVQGFQMKNSIKSQTVLKRGQKKALLIV